LNGAAAPSACRHIYLYGLSPIIHATQTCLKGARQQWDTITCSTAKLETSLALLLTVPDSSETTEKLLHPQPKQANDK